MKIAIIGPGNMGSALGKIWAARGHEVIWSHAQSEEKLNELVIQTPGTVKMALQEAIAAAEVVTITTQYSGLAALFQHAAAFAGKTVISCTSALQPDFTGTTIGLPTERLVSVAEEIAAKLPGAKVVEAFNIAFAENLKQLAQLAGKPQGSIFYCGDDVEAKKTAARLIRDCNYEPVNAGLLKTARCLETLATTWVQFAVAGGLYPRIIFGTITF